MIEKIIIETEVGGYYCYPCVLWLELKTGTRIVAHYFNRFYTHPSYFQAHYLHILIKCSLDPLLLNNSKKTTFFPQYTVMILQSLLYT